MKSEGAVRSRLVKLRKRYRNKHASNSQKRVPSNCVYNATIEPKGYRAPSVITELEMSPRIVSNLVVFQEDSSIKICTYGSENPAEWNGDVVCDSNDVAEQCKFFKAKSTYAEAAEEFDGMMEDDEFVYDNYRDVATLQWVLDDRVHLIPLTWRDRLSLLLIRFFDWMLRRNRQKLPSQLMVIPHDIWNDRDDSDQSSGK